MTYLPHYPRVTLDAVMKDIDAALRPYRCDINAVYCTGLSGIIPSSIYAYAHRLELVVLRRDEERSHGRMIEGATLDHHKFAIIDDFIDTGATLKRLLSEANWWDRAKVVRPRVILLYSNSPNNKLVQKWAGENNFGVNDDHPCIMVPHDLAQNNAR